MKKNKESKPSFWSTLPGILTALGATIAAFAGLITALYSAGVIGNKNKPPDNPPTINSANLESQSNNSQRPEQTTPTEASRNFIIGRWQVEQTAGEVSAGTVVNYEENGTFGGSMTKFVGSVGQKQPTAGYWDIEKLSKDMFRLKIRFEDNSTWVGTFKIIDHDHIHNIDQNYIAVRSK